MDIIWDAENYFCRRCECNACIFLILNGARKEKRETAGLRAGNLSSCFFLVIHVFI